MTCGGVLVPAGRGRRDPGQEARRPRVFPTLPVRCAPTTAQVSLTATGRGEDTSCVTDGTHHVWQSRTHRPGAGTTHSRSGSFGGAAPRPPSRGRSAVARGFRRCREVPHAGRPNGLPPCRNASPSRTHWCVTPSPPRCPRPEGSGAAHGLGEAPRGRPLLRARALEYAGERLAAADACGALSRFVDSTGAPPDRRSHTCALSTGRLRWHLSCMRDTRQARMPP